MNRISIGLAATLAVTGVSASAQLKVDPPAIDAVFVEYATDTGPGCALGVIHEQNLVYAKGYGMANLDWKAPITPSTNFYIASIGKQFSAAAIAHAARAGHLSLDDTLRKWVPEMPEYAEAISVRQMIHHTSGLRDSLGLLRLAGIDLRDIYTSETVLELVARQKEANFPAGERYAYNNAGYFLLSVIIERATGKSLAAYSDEHFFQPLGMKSTLFMDDRREVIDQRAVGYTLFGDEPQMNHLWDFQLVGSGGVNTTIEDLALWDRNFYTEEVGGEGFTSQLLELGTLNDGSQTNYGFGLGVGTYRGLENVRHGGSLAAFRTHMTRFPDQEATIFVLCNTVADAQGMALKVADIVLEDVLEPRDEPEADPVAEVPSTREELPVELSGEQLNAFVGHWYASDINVTFELLVEDDALFLENGERVEAIVLADNKVAITQAGAVLTFNDFADGKFGSIDIVQGGRKFGASRPEPIANPSQYVGDYYSDELDATYSIRVDEGQLLIENGSNLDGTVISTGKENTFQMPFGSIVFHRVDDAIAAFTLDAGRSSGLRFEKR